MDLLYNIDQDEVILKPMNYFTKGWYELCQRTSAHFFLEEAEEAEILSEEYFRLLYGRKEAEFLALQEEVASAAFDDLYPAEMSTEYFYKNMPEADIAELKAAYQARREVAKERYIPHEPFDREKAAGQFHQAFLYNQEHTKKILPADILKEIADIRVYVLGKASRQVISDVTRFCEDNNNSVKRTIGEYDEYYKNALKSFDSDIVDKINFHDCVITDIRQTDRTLAILFDNSGGFTDIDEMALENYEIIKQDAKLQNSIWLYHEIYKTEGKYELHVLLYGKEAELLELIISAGHISFSKKTKNSGGDV